MNKEFVSYEIGMKLKELGFDMMCIGSYTNVKKFNFTGGNMYRVTSYPDDKPEFCIAPLWQQAFEWFRVQQNLLGVVDYDETTKKYYFFINTMDGEEINFSRDFETYDDAQLRCLEKLIEYSKSTHE